MFEQITDKRIKDAVKVVNNLVAVFTKAGFTKDNDEIELKTIIKVLTGMINSINEVYKSKEAVEHINTEEIPEPDKNTGIRTPEKIKTDKKEENTYSDTRTKEELPEHSNISSEFEEKEGIPEKHLRFHFKDE